IICAGDFAQLPPVGGYPLYEVFMHPGGARMSRYEQESRIGRALWCQFLTVVILTENMRQTIQSEDDAKLRKALTNMRYCECTKEDLKFLRTLVAKSDDPTRSLSNDRFRNTAVITAWNLQKDRINQLGSQRFASETGQALKNFCSVDSLATSSTRSRKKSKAHAENPAKLTTALQRAIWQCQHSESEHVAGVLSLCKGLPVVLRYNDATELCMTKGQEAMVLDWDSNKSTTGEDILQTLYVKLINPPKVITIRGLPENVVPIVRRSSSVTCVLPNGTTVSLRRSQVPILPNFAMTDYASQGKTRKFNVVDLHNCKNHLSFYTCLSRSTSAENTILIQGFDEGKITGGKMVKYLRAELRELEMLDNINKYLLE
ncbi:hypothetical protein PLEOSDRAFT_1011016, partial [Pleurotus ostreatus PC15]